MCFKRLCLLVLGAGLDTSHHPLPQVKDKGQRAELEGGWPLTTGALEKHWKSSFRTTSNNDYMASDQKHCKMLHPWRH